MCKIPGRGRNTPHMTLNLQDADYFQMPTHADLSAEGGRLFGLEDSCIFLLNITQPWSWKERKSLFFLNLPHGVKYKK